MEEHFNERGRLGSYKMYADLQYYKGFYEGVKTIIEFLGNSTEDEQVKNDVPDVTVQKIEGKNAKKFIEMLRKLGVDEHE